jgi:hypothetical protein
MSITKSIKMYVSTFKLLMINYNLYRQQSKTYEVNVEKPKKMSHVWLNGEKNITFPIKADFTLQITSYL